MRLQDAAYTKIMLVTLPEMTPVSEAAALQDDLRRASIEPYAWVVNKSSGGRHARPLAGGATVRRAQADGPHVAGLAKRIFTLAWLTVPPIGFAELSKLVGGRSAPGDHERLGRTLSPFADGPNRAARADVRSVRRMLTPCRR